MTVHILKTKEKPVFPHPHKRKVVEIIAMLKRGQALSATDLEEHCDVSSANVMTTLRLLEEYGLICFAGWGERRANGGHFPATWRWV